MRPPLADGVIEAAGLRLEAAWHGPPPAEAPTLVFLHEGLGCVELWRDFPAALAARTGCGALVYSRAGYGRSQPCALPRPLTYMHEEARRVLPALLAAAGIGRHVLVGHSDGASIALVNAGDCPRDGLAGVICEAPHVFTEADGLASIAAARQAFESGDLRDRLARYHGDNVDCAFEGWAGAWLDPGFRAWNLEEFLPGIAVPLLVIQGEDDEYGSRAQPEAVTGQAGGPAELLMLPDCGHAPHRDRREASLEAMARFIDRVAATG